MKLLDWVIIIFLFFLLAFALVWYYHAEINSCTKEPLVYGAKVMERNYGYDFIGWGTFLVQGSPAITFNSENISIRN